MAKKKLSYRESAAEIESILTAIDEETEVDIDELATRLERAAELIRFCSDRLRSAEMRVEKVTRDLARTVEGESSEAEDEASED